MKDRSHKGQREASARKRQRRDENAAKLARDAAAAGVPVHVLTTQRMNVAQAVVARVAKFMPKPVTISAPRGESYRSPAISRPGANRLNF